MKSTSVGSEFVAPVLQALKGIEFRLASDKLFSIIVAAASLDEFQRQELPAHLEVTPRRRVGKRVATRERQRYNELASTTANWPKDNLVESALPSVGYVINGQPALDVADYMIHCQAGDIILFPPGVPKTAGRCAHFLGEINGRSSDILWIRTLRTRLSGVRFYVCRSDEKGHRSGHNLGSCWVPHSLSAALFHGFCEEAQQGRKREIVKQLLLNMVTLLRDEIECGNVLEEWGRPRAHGEDRQQDPIAEALAYLEENLHNGPTINDVARHIYVSPATLTKRFKERTGETFAQYQTKLRLQKAEEMLRQHDYTILQICQHIGLQHGRFWILFKEVHGCSPSEYRKRCISEK